MFFRAYMKNFTYTISVSRNILIKDAFVQTLCNKTVRNKFGSELDLDLMLGDCLDNKDALWIFDQGELWQFNFLFSGCSFLVLLAPYKQIGDLFKEAQRVFRSLYELESWKDVHSILHCRKDENIWSVWQRSIENLNFSTIFSIFKNKDTIYCCKEQVQLQDTVLLFLPGGKRGEYDELRLSLEIIEKRSRIPFVNSDCLTWKWVLFDESKDTGGFYFKTRNSPSLVSEEFLENLTNEKDFRDESSYLSASIIGKIESVESNTCSEPQDTNIMVSSTASCLPPTPKPVVLHSVIVSDDTDDTSYDSPSLQNRFTANLKHNVTFLNGVLCKNQDDLKDVVLNGALGSKHELTKEYIETYIEGFLRTPFQCLTYKKLYRQLRKKFNTDIIKWRKFIKYNFDQQKKTAQSAESLFSRKPSFLTDKDIHTLDPGCWINDQIINSYLKLVIAKSKTKSIYAFSSFFHTCLRTNGFTAVRRWTKKVDIFQNDLVMFPIHSKKHWVLAVASIPEKEKYDSKFPLTLYLNKMFGIAGVFPPNAKVITYYNPLHRRPNDRFQKVLKDYLNQESFAKQHKNMTWELKTCLDNPIQQTTDDCGVFICLYAKCLAFDMPMNFTQNNILLARKLIAKEICSEKITLKIY